LVTDKGRHVRLAGQDRHVALRERRSQQRPELTSHDDPPNASATRGASLGSFLIHLRPHLYSRVRPDEVAGAAWDVACPPLSRIASSGGTENSGNGPCPRK